MVLPALDNSQMMLIGVLDLLNLFITRFTDNFFCYSQRWKAIFIACQVDQFRTPRGYPHFQGLRSSWLTNYILRVLIFFSFFLLMHYTDCEILCPLPGIELGPWQWKCWVLIIGNSRPPCTCICYCCLVAKSCLTLCDPMDCGPPGSSIHGISQARLLEWVAVSVSRGSSQPRDWAHVSWIGRQILYQWAGRCRAAQLASIRLMSGQVSRGSAGEYQADERACVARLSWRVHREISLRVVLHFK